MADLVFRPDQARPRQNTYTEKTLLVKTTPTLSNSVLDSAFLGVLLPAAFALFTQFGQDIRSHGINDLGQYGIAGVEQPRVRQGGVVEVDAALEHRVL